MTIDDSITTDSAQPIDLTVEFDSNPNNVVPSSPRFSWRGAADHRGGRQTAYRILVASSLADLEAEHGTVWDSGKITSSRSSGVTYEGARLESDTTYYWTVQYWGETRTPSAFADACRFTTALRDRSEWGGVWITYQPDSGDSNGYRSQWREINRDQGDACGADEVREWVQVDLGESIDISRVDLYPAAPFRRLTSPDGGVVTPLHSHSRQDDAAGIDGNYHWTGDRAAGFGFPYGYRVEASDDPTFTESETLVDRTDECQSNPGSETISVDGDCTGRYVRVVATNLYQFDPFDAFQLRTSDSDHYDGAQLHADLLCEEYRTWKVFALGALAVVDGEGTDVARGQPVTASSSVESETWGTARLVDGVYNPSPAVSSPLLRTEVTLTKPVTRARLHVAALGYGELYLNGKRVGDAVLDPVWTQYDERIEYTTYDVEDRLEEGSNAIGIWLGRGWFSKSFRDWTGFGSPRALLQLTVEYEDGTSRQVVSSPDWTAASSPVLKNDVYDGETYDARQEQPGWATAEFDDSEWEHAARVAAPGGRLKPQQMPPMRVTNTAAPAQIREADGAYVVDFGRIVTGWVEFELTDPERGEPVRVEHAEALTEDGSLSTVDLRSAEATDQYIPRGDDRERYHPRFTIHGFRYVRISGCRRALDPSSVSAHVVHTDLDRTGHFECSDERINRIQSCAVRSLLSNTQSVPTDCPQRDERFGWTGDAVRTAESWMYNFDAATFFEKWTADHDDTQSTHGYVGDTVPFGFGSIPGDPVWTLTRVVIPWYHHRHYADEAILERSYPGMRRYVEYWHSVADGDLLPGTHVFYGDWLAFECRDEDDPRRGGPFDLFAAAAHYQATATLAEAATLLGYEADAVQYARRADRIRDTFNDRFFDREAGRYRPDTQAAQALPLRLGLVPDGTETETVDYLASKVRRDGHLRTGFVGTRELLHALSEHGHAGRALELVRAEEPPSWGYMVDRGATTVWERWNSDEEVGSGMNSLNHSSLAYVSEWFFRELAGLDCSVTCRRRIEIAPRAVSGLDWVSGTIQTPWGTASSRWERTADGIILQIHVPWNTTATVRVPLPTEGASVSENGDRVWPRKGALPDGVCEVVASNSEYLTLEIDAGQYEFEAVSDGA